MSGKVTVSGTDAVSGTFNYWSLRWVAAGLLVLFALGAWFVNSRNLGPGNSVKVDQIAALVSKIDRVSEIVPQQVENACVMRVVTHNARTYAHGDWYELFERLATAGAQGLMVPTEPAYPRLAAGTFVGATMASHDQIVIFLYSADGSPIFAGDYWINSADLDFSSTPCTPYK